MATVLQFEVKNYAVSLFSGTDLRFHERILLYGADGNFAQVQFYEEGATMPPPKVYTPSPIDIFLSYRSKRFASVLDLVRNEKPVYAWYDEGQRSGAISTDLERVGEGERE
jgi:hypothetical protein